MAKKSARQFDTDVKKEMEIYEILAKAEKKYIDTLNLKKNINIEQQKALQLTIEEQKYLTMKNQLEQQFGDLSDKAKKDIEGQLEAQVKTIGTLKKEVEEAKKYAGIWDKIAKSTKKVFDVSNNILGSMSSFDKPIRETVLNLGLGAEKGQQMRDSFEGAAVQAYALGGSLEDLRDIQKEYAEGTSRTVGLTAQELINVQEIARGTTLGAAGAGKLAGQFAIMGKDIKQTHEFIQGVVDASERMGINSNNVIKGLSDNYKKLNSFGFKAGVEGMKKMALYSEKFKISISEALDSADMARTLEGSIEMAATLNTLGGEFAKTDPFELLYLSRNDPAKYTQKINEMTKGMASLVDTGNGFEMQVTPMDLDRLREASKALGIPYENLVEQTKQMGHYQKMNNQLVGKGFSKDQLETIQAMAKLDGKSGIYKVMGKNISDLSAAEVEKLKIQQTSLEERAKNAQTFDEKFDNTIKQFKSTLLPLLEGVNLLFDGISPLVNELTKGIKWLMDINPSITKWTGAFLLGSLTLSKIKTLATGSGLFGGGGGLSKAAGGSGAGGAIGGGGGGGGASFGSGAGGALKGLGQGAGVGLAAVGMGAGINLAAQGIAKLADSMAKLTPEQAKTLQNIAMTLAISFPLAAIGIALAGTAATAGAVGLLALGASMLMIGAAVGIAAAGIGYMAEGFSKLKDVDLMDIALGISAIGLAMSTFAIGGITSLLAGGGGVGMLLILASQADEFTKIGNAMKSIGTVLNANPESLTKFKETLDAISNFKSGDSLSELKDLFAKPIRVEFDKKSVTMSVKSEIQLDGEVLARAVAKRIVSIQQQLKN